MPRALALTPPESPPQRCTFGPYALVEVVDVHYIAATGEWIVMPIPGLWALPGGGFRRSHELRKMALARGWSMGLSAVDNR